MTNGLWPWPPSYYEALAQSDSSVAAATAGGTTARRLRDWLTNPELLRAPRVVLPHIAHEGRVTLLSGREKIGKSTFVAGAVARASCNDSVLGVSLVGPVRTLWYSIDEPVADTVRRFHALGADHDRITINAAPRSVRDLLAALECDLVFADADLVVVDTLSRAIAGEGVDPNSSREIEPVLARLVDSFHAANVASVLVYHTGKGGKDYRGSTAIGATVDDILTLRRRGQAQEDDFEDDADDDGRRLLVQDGRNLRGRLHLTCVGGHYQVFDDSDPPRARVLEALRAHGAAKSRTELVQLAGVQKKRGLMLIAALISEGMINEKAGTGRLTLSSASSQWFPRGRTAAEPDAGTNGMPEASAGSPSRNPTPTTAGTDDSDSSLEEAEWPL
jgi:hypothetical protein